MKINIIYIISILLNTFISKAQTHNLNPSQWALQWSDDFTSSGWQVCYDGVHHVLTSGTGCSASHWFVEDDDDRGEPQAFRPDNVTLTTDGSGLRIETKRESPVFTCTSCGGPLTPASCSSTGSYQEHYYSSGGINSFGDHMPLYGYVETRMKISDTYGLWPAFWMWNDNGLPNTDPGYVYNEVDMFEMTPGGLTICEYSPYCNTFRDKNDLGSNVGVAFTNTAGECTGPNQTGQYLYINDCTQWHTYGIEWSPSKIIYYVDDVAIWKHVNTGWTPTSVGAIALNLSIILAVGIYPAVRYPDADYCSIASDEATYYDIPTGWSGGGPGTGLNDGSARYTYIQYVSYYTLVTDCSTDLTITNNTDLTDYDNKVKKSITISGSGISGSSTPASLRASEYILIDGSSGNDFTVPLGQELYLDASATCQ